MKFSRSTKITTSTLISGVTFFSISQLVLQPIFAADDKISSVDRRILLLYDFMFLAVASLCAFPYWTSVFREDGTIHPGSMYKKFFNLAWQVKSLITGAISAAILFGFLQVLQDIVFIFDKKQDVSAKQNLINSLIFLAVAMPAMILICMVYLHARHQTNDEAGQELITENDTSYGTL